MSEDQSAQKRVERKVRIHKSEIPQELSDKAVGYVYDAMEKYQIEKDMATYIKKKCDEELTGTWHCVVGRNFGCSITHDTKYVIFFQRTIFNQSRIEDCLRKKNEE